jgi:predicted transcriptional regulator
MLRTKYTNEQAWIELFEERKIIADVEQLGRHIITATEINKKREARLMTKFDHHINLPKVFRDNKFSILPNTRGSYIISTFQSYQNLPNIEHEKIQLFSLPEHLQTISSENLYSESAVLLCALHAELIADVANEEDIKLTVFGRMSTGNFDFLIKDIKAKTIHNVQIDRVQCEIDGGFEALSKFLIIEAKNETVDDFHIRQLYFPYRLWQNKITKLVQPIFLTYSNEVFSFYIYQFADPDNYNSLELIQVKRYRIAPQEITLSDIRNIFNRISLDSHKKVQEIPQANSFERVIDLLGKLKIAGDSLTQIEITTNYAFDTRQTQYYTNTMIHLGLLERKQTQERGVFYTLTEFGKKIINKEPTARNLDLVELILSQKIFYETMKLYLKNAQLPTQEVVIECMKDLNLSIGGTTVGRRASTVQSWLKWIMNLTIE